MKTIYLVRHGEIPHAKPRRFIGRTELSLTPRGQQQMAALGTILAPQKIERIVCSPLSRCQESGGILAASCAAKIETECDLAEIDLGDWEGLLVAEVKAKFPGGYEARGEDLPGYRPPHGESFSDLADRVWPALLRIIDTSVSQTVVVAHAGVNRVLLCRILGIPLENMFLLQQDYGCYNVVSVNRTGMRVACMNCMPV